MIDPVAENFVDEQPVANQAPTVTQPVNTAAAAASALINSNPDRSIVQHILVYTFETYDEKGVATPTLAHIVPPLTSVEQDAAAKTEASPFDQVQGTEDAPKKLGLPEKWANLPSLGLPLNERANEEEFFAFTVPSLVDQDELSGLSCYRCKVSDGDPALTEKAVIILSTMPLPRSFKIKLSIITRALFEQQDPTNFDIIDALYTNVKSNEKILQEYEDEDDFVEVEHPRGAGDFSFEDVASTITRSMAPVSATLEKAFITAEGAIASTITKLRDPEQQRAIQDNISRTLLNAESSLGRALDTAEDSVVKAYTTAEESVMKAVSTLTDPEAHKKLQEGASQVLNNVSSWFSTQTSSWGMGWGEHANPPLQESAKQEGPVTEEVDEAGYHVVDPTGDDAVGPTAADLKGGESNL